MWRRRNNIEKYVKNERDAKWPSGLQMLPLLRSLALAKAGPFQGCVSIAQAWTWAAFLGVLLLCRWAVLPSHPCVPEVCGHVCEFAVGGQGCCPALSFLA